MNILAQIIIRIVSTFFIFYILNNDKYGIHMSIAYLLLGIITIYITKKTENSINKKRIDNFIYLSYFVYFAIFIYFYQVRGPINNKLYVTKIDNAMHQLRVSLAKSKSK